MVSPNDYRQLLRYTQSSREESIRRILEEMEEMCDLRDRPGVSIDDAEFDAMQEELHQSLMKLALTVNELIESSDQVEVSKSDGTTNVTQFSGTLNNPFDQTVLDDFQTTLDAADESIDSTVDDGSG